MKVLYLSEGEDLVVLPLGTLLSNFNNSGVNVKDLKDMLADVEAQGFHIGLVNGFKVAVICLDLPSATITVTPKRKEKNGA